MEESNTEDLLTNMDCDNTNQSLESDKSEEYFKGFDLSHINDSLEKLKSSIYENKIEETDEENASDDSIDKLNPTDSDNEDKDQEFIDNLFDGDMDDFDSDDFMKGSPLGENLELDKIMEELKDTIEQDIFGSENITRNLNIDHLKESDPELENILNNDIISYINSDEGPIMDNKSVCNNDVVTKPKKKYKAAPQHLENENRVRQENAIISLINKELEDTLQFTNYLCHYIYNDVIVGRDFFKLFSTKAIKTDTSIVNNTVV